MAGANHVPARTILVHRAPQVRARRVQHIEAAGTMDDVVGSANDPDTVGLFESLVDAHAEVGRKADLVGNGNTRLLIQINGAVMYSFVSWVG